MRLLKYRWEVYMRTIIRTILGALAIVCALTVVAASAASVVAESGMVVRIDPQSNVVVLDNGRMYRVTPQTVLVIDNRPVPLTAVQPGQRVVVQSGEVVTLRDGQYVAVMPAAPTVGQPMPLAAPATPVGVRQTV